MAKIKDDDSWYYRGVKRRDFRHGAVDEDDFEDDYRYVRLSKVPHKWCGKTPGERCKDLTKVLRWSYTTRDGIVRNFYHYQCKVCGRVRWRFPL